MKRISYTELAIAITEHPDYIIDGINLTNGCICSGNLVLIAFAIVYWAFFPTIYKRLSLPSDAMRRLIK